MAQRLIDANALTNKYGDWYTEEGTEEGFIGSLKTLIDAQPTIDAEPQWIPCSERPPENMKPVNITWVNRDPVSYYTHIKDKPFTATGIYFKGKWYWYSAICEDILEEYEENDIDVVDDSIEITAWRPLPEPYEGEGKMSETFDVGDEVQYIPADGRVVKPRFVITSFSRDGSLNGIGKDGIAFCDKNPARWCKTGRHFVEAEKLMKALEADRE